MTTPRPWTWRIDFPTGNGEVRVLDDRTVWVGPDPRGSEGRRWYWHISFRTTRPFVLTLCLGRADVVGRLGLLAVRRGRARWVLPDTDGAFRTTLLPGGDTRLCPTWCYGPRELAAFRRRHGRRLRWISLPHVPRRHAAPVGRAGPVAADRTIVLTARHHACEAMASFVLEGAAEAFLALQDTGTPEVAGTALLIVPFVDVDGVRRGDQGKNRVPHDHNRDYAENGSLYPTVRALRRLVTGEPGRLVALDFHTPGLRGPLEERPYVVSAGDDDAERLRVVREGVHGTGLLVLDGDWNRPESTGERCFVAWVRSLRESGDAFTVEYPNAVAGCRSVDPGVARMYGEQVLLSLLARP